MGGDLVGHQGGAALGGAGPQQGRLAPGPGAQVQPALVTPLKGGLGEHQGHELAALVLHART